MRKGREFHDKPVIEINSGRLLGYVKGFKLGTQREIAGLYLRTTENRHLLFPYSSIASLGRDAVLVNTWSGGTETVAEEIDAGQFGFWVVTAAGENIGKVEDIVIEEKDGSITGYVVSDGLIKDVILGKRIVPVTDVVAYGEDAVIIGDTPLE